MKKSNIKVILPALVCVILLIVGAVYFISSNGKNDISGDSTVVSDSTNQATDSSMIATPSEEAGNKPADGSSIASSTDSQHVKETIDLKLYYYDADDYDKPKEIRKVTVDKKTYQDDKVKALNEVFASADLSVNKAIVDGNSMTVDFTKDEALKFNNGSAGGITYTNILASTILNLPNINQLKVTIDGEAGIEGDHFSFNGVFKKSNGDKSYTFKMN